MNADINGMQVVYEQDNFQTMSHDIKEHTITLRLQNPVPTDRVGLLGRTTKKFVQQLNDCFASENWELGYAINGSFVTRDVALELYENSYKKFFENNPEILNRLLSEASDVYDNNPRDVEAGLKWEDPNSSQAHLQDVAIRRAVISLGRSFQGSKLVQVKSTGDFPELSPGQVPFCMPEIIIDDRVCEKDWIQHGSIEDFWQNNKFLFIENSSDVRQNAKEKFLCIIEDNQKNERHNLRRVARYLAATGEFTQDLAEKFCEYLTSHDLGGNLSQQGRGWIKGVLDNISMLHDAQFITEIEALDFSQSVAFALHGVTDFNELKYSLSTSDSSPIIRASFYVNYLKPEILSNVFCVDLLTGMIDDKKAIESMTNPHLIERLKACLVADPTNCDLFLERLKGAGLDSENFSVFKAKVLQPLLAQIEGGQGLSLIAKLDTIKVFSSL